jgi:signal transduction histidine kinase
MDSDPHLPPVAVLAAGAGLLLAAAFGFGCAWQSGAAAGAGAWVGSGAAALAGLAFMRRGWRALPLHGALPPMERPVGLTQDQQQLAARALALETQLEFAPIALFRLHDAPAGSFEPVNANARRLLAPGRAADVGALQRTVCALAAGRRSVIDIDTEHGSERALAIASTLTVEGQPQRLVALMPMENELKAEAMQAWQQLVHVLTHEIMNSLTPVASLSHTSRELLAGVRAELPADIADDLDIALDAISRRADSLTHFVSGYRSLASVPEARPQRIDMAALFARLSALVATAWQARGGSAHFEVEPAALELMADPGQLEQALVNLIQNAADACAEQANPQVTVSARLVRGGRLRLEVSDNGPGVPDQLAADIFTPFFTTKSKGSGIGLAMVRQLVHRNGGAVRYARALGGGARFVITF